MQDLYRKQYDWSVRRVRFYTLTLKGLVLFKAFGVQRPYSMRPLLLF